MIPFPTFMGMASAAFRRAQHEIPDPYSLPPFEETKVFYLGDDADFTAAIEDIRPDLHEEMRDGIPMPFKDVSVVTIVKKPLPSDDEKKLFKDAFGIEVKDEHLIIPDGAPVWVLDRTMLVGESHPAVRQMLKYSQGETEEVKQWFVMARFHAFEGVKTAAMAWAFGYCGVMEDGRVRTLCEETVRPLGNNMVSNLEQIAAISHPANYIVKVSPELKPKEIRQVAEGRARPAEKKVHFIVVDHEVLVGMRPSKGGTHASPVPHERRGHWMRLAERCRHSRLMGKDKVWVRPTFIGEREWSSNKAHYEVLLDFNKKEIGV